MEEKQIDLKKGGTKNKFNYILHQLSKKEKIIWVIQMVVSISVLTLAVLGINDVISIYLTNTIDLILLTFLFLMGGIRLFSERMVYAILYFVLAALMCTILILSFFL